MENSHGHERVAQELREEDLDTVSAGKTLHFGHFGKLHFGKLHLGKDLVQTNIAVRLVWPSAAASYRLSISQTLAIRCSA